MGFYLIIALVIISVIYIFSRSSTVPTDDVEYSQVIRYFEEDKVAYFKLEGDELTMRLNEIDENTGREKIVTHTLANVEQFWNDCGETITALRVSSKDFQYDYTTGWSMPWWVSLVPYVLIFVVFIVIWSMMMKNYGGVGGDRGVTKFGKAHTRLGSEEKHRITFADVAGAEEEKEELWEIVDFLRNPQKYTALGARIPKGVLLVGPPGTGKTLLAKAVAGEAGVQFLSISGSDFVELYVGVGASRVRDLFEQAKKLAPAIIFIDEIDAEGRQRGAGLGGGHDEREQTLNQLLVEMDGFTSNEGVIVIAATNRADILDNALLRPGRFDRQVFVAPPDIRGREEILKVHARGKMLAEDVDLSSIAKGTPGFTGADLENLLNEAALLSARRRKPFISKAEIEDAILKVMAGPEKKSRVVTEKERRLTAYHEAGHAVVAHFLEHADPVHHITIIPHGAAGGMTVYRPVEDKSFNSKSDMFERIITALGGRISEKIMLDDISTGASNDIQQASAIARAMVTKYGMSDRLGPISYDSSSNSIFIGRDFQHTKSYSEETAALIDEEVKRIFDEASARCEEILSAHRNIIESVAGYLLEHETMDGKDFAYVCDHDGELPPVQEPAQQPESPAGAFSETTSVAEQELPGQMPQQPVTDTDFVDITPPEDGENPFETEEK
ncbi:MAG: ATP-dependent zinc metalloprotease FtsH [Oscillospiraceae bacterium]|nr:ATP-dependent zinc metalloprotease FtsH [Oscillospiraceae bacterium]